MKIGFTTLGCPAWDVDTICRRGTEYGFDGVDFRGMQDGIDITVMREFTTDLAVTKRRFTDAGLAVSGISSSLRICERDRLDENLEEARRTIPLAHALEVTTIRVFGAGDSVQYPRVELADTGQRTMEAVFKIDGAHAFNWAFETHDQWIAATDCTLLLDRIPDPAFGALWDMGHTTRVGGESPEVSVDALGDRIYCLHVKDAIYDPDHPKAMEDGWRYVAPGNGQLPLSEAIALVRRRGYDGWLIFEHEKRWHQDLPEPEEIFPQFIEWYRGL